MYTLGLGSTAQDFDCLGFSERKQGRIYVRPGGREKRKGKERKGEERGEERKK